MKYLFLFLLLLFCFVLPAQVRPDQQGALSDPTGTDAFYTQERGQLRKIYLSVLRRYYAPDIDTLVARIYSPATSTPPVSDYVKWIKGNDGHIWYIDGEGRAIRMQRSAGSAYDPQPVLDTIATLDLAIAGLNEELNAFGDDLEDKVDALVFRDSIAALRIFTQARIDEIITRMDELDEIENRVDAIALSTASDFDGDSLNELQALSLVGDQLSLSRGGGTIVLPSGGGGGYSVVSETSLRQAAASSTRQEIFINNAVPIATAIDLPKTINLTFGPLGYIEGADNVTIRAWGKIDAEEDHIFRGEANFILPAGKAQLEWFGGVGDGVTDSDFNVISGTPNYHALRKAMISLSESGGEINIGRGVFIMQDTTDAVRSVLAGSGREYSEKDVGIAFYDRITGGPVNEYNIYNGITVRGSGDSTIVVPPNTDTGTGADYGPYRNVGFDRSVDGSVTYEENVLAGQSFVDVRVLADAARFEPGQIIGIQSGASFFDQEHTLMNVVDSVAGSRVYLRNPIPINMTLETTSSRGETTAPFTAPAEGETATVQTSQGIGDASGVFSLGNDLYQVVNDLGGGSYEVENLTGKGNAASGTVFPTGTTTRKARILYLANSTPRGNWVKDMTLIGRKDGITVSNFYDCGMENVRLIQSRQNPASGLWINGDGGYGFMMRNCEVETAGGQRLNGQLARSVTEVHFEGCTFREVGNDISEFTRNVYYDNCNFYLDGEANSGGPQDKQGNYALNIGRTTNNINVTNSNFWVYGSDRVIQSLDIVTHEATSGGLASIKGCNFYYNEVGTVISSGSLMQINDSRFVGKASKVFSIGKVGPDDATSITGFGSVSNLGGTCKISDVEVTGSFDQLLSTQSRNLITRNLTVFNTRAEADFTANGVSRGVLVSDDGEPTDTAFMTDIEMVVYGVPLGMDHPPVQYEGVMSGRMKVQVDMYRSPYQGGVVDSSFCVGPGCITGGIDYSADIAGFQALFDSLSARIDALENAGNSHRIVFTGASIMDQMLNRRDMQAALSAAFPDKTIEVVDFAKSGATTQTKAAELATEITTLPAPGSDGFITHFFNHIGGNNVSATRPFASITSQEEQDFADGLRDIKNIILGAGFSEDNIHFQQLTWRNYDLDESAFVNEDLGSAPYNANFLDSLTNPGARHADGRPYWDLYVWALNNRNYLEDEVHFDATGELEMQNYFINTMGAYIMNGTVPTQLVKDQPSAGGGGDTIVVSFGNEISNSFAGGINIFAAPDNGGVTTAISTTSYNAVRNTSGALTSVTFDLTGTDANSAGNGNAGNTTASIENNDLLSESVYAGGDNDLVLDFAGLPANTNVELKLAGSRSATDGRTQSFAATGATTSTGYDIGAIPVDIVTLFATTSGTGTLNITVTPTNSVGFCYLNGFAIIPQ